MRPIGSAAWTATPEHSLAAQNWTRLYKSSQILERSPRSRPASGSVAFVGGAVVVQHGAVSRVCRSYDLCSQPRETVSDQQEGVNASPCRNGQERLPPFASQVIVIMHVSSRMVPLTAWTTMSGARTTCSRWAGTV